jgi:branched-chain amino acid transport system substrate-binding protein
MRKHFGWRVRIPVAMLVVAVGLTIAATGFSKTSGTHATASAAQPCGTGGSKATGTPILLGGIATKQPGTDFTDITNTAGDYFQCVNDNGGIHGHPIQYTTLTEATVPAQDAADAKQLIATDHVLGLVGNTSIIDCAVNGAYYKAQGFSVIDAGIAEQCYASPWSAAVNMGPRYSADGATQTAIKLGAKKIAFDQSDVPGTSYNVGGSVLIAKAAKVPLVQLTENAASLNGETVAEKEVQAAGTGGAVVMVFTPPVALEILQGAQKLGLENKVIWTCATPCNTDFLAAALGPAWNHKLYVNAEMALASNNGPNSILYRKVMSLYGSNVTGGLGNFSQFGFTAAQIAVKALLTIKGAYTVKSVNAAFQAVKGYTSDMLCKPWYYGKAAVHLPNNVDRTVWPQNGKMVQQAGCFQISAVDPEVKQVRAIEKAQGL